MKAEMRVLQLERAIQRVLHEDWDDLIPTDGLQTRSARVFLAGVLKTPELAQTMSPCPLDGRTDDHTHTDDEWADYDAQQRYEQHEELKLQDQMRAHDEEMPEPERNDEPERLS